MLEEQSSPPHDVKNAARAPHCFCFFAAFDQVAFFCEEMGASLEDLREVLPTSPNLLLVSVELALAPRVAAMKDAGVSVSFSLHWNEVAFGPRGDAFDAWVASQARRSRG